MRGEFNGSCRFASGLRKLLLRLGRQQVPLKAVEQASFNLAWLPEQ
jgi:hypothetical protein